MPWRELVEGYKIDIEWNSSSANRTYIEDPNGTDPLPRWFEVHPTRSNLFVTARHIDLYGGDPDIQRVIIDYSSDLDADNSELNVTPADLPRSMDIGGEYYTIKDPSGWYWVGGDGSGGSVRANQPVFRRVVTGTLKITKIATTLDLDTIIPLSGMLNSTPFPAGIDGITPRAAGQWMFIAAPAEEFRNVDGDKRWRIVYHFAFRTVTGVNEARKDGWEYMFREDRMIWDRVNNSASGQGTGLYEFADLNTLLTDPAGSSGALGEEVGDSLSGPSVGGGGELGRP